MPIDWLPDDVKQWHIENEKRQTEDARKNLERRVETLSRNIENALKLKIITDRDRGALNYAKQEIVSRWKNLELVFLELESLSPDLHRRLLMNLDHFTEGLAQGANKGGASESAKLLGKGMPRARQREKKAEKTQSRRDAITEAVLASASVIKSGVTYPSEGKLADALYSDVKARLRGTGVTAGQTTIQRRLTQLFAEQKLSRSSLVGRK